MNCFPRLRFLRYAVFYFFPYTLAQGLFSVFLHKSILSGFIPQKSFSKNRKHRLNADVWKMRNFHCVENALTAKTKKRIPYVNCFPRLRFLRHAVFYFFPYTLAQGLFSVFLHKSILSGFIHQESIHTNRKQRLNADVWKMRNFRCVENALTAKSKKETM